jgi:anti-anti-sigma factor
LAHSITSTSDPRGTVVAIGGDADLNAAAELEDALSRAAIETLGSGDERVIVIDLSGSNFVDSRTISVIVSWVEKLAGRAWRVPIVCSDERLLSVFTAVGLEDELDFYPTLEAAFAG